MDPSGVELKERLLSYDDDVEVSQPQHPELASASSSPAASSGAPYEQPPHPGLLNAYGSSTPDEDAELERRYASNSNFLAPSAKLAEERAAEKKEGRRFPLDTDTIFLGQVYGPGIGLYFSFLKQAAIVLLIVALFYLPSVLENVRGGHVVLPDEYRGTTSTFFSWSSYAASANWIVATSLQHHDGLLGSRLQEQVDAVVVFLLIAFIFYILPNRHERVDSLCSAGEVVAEDYTVMVRSLPTNATPLEVSTYFSRFGEVLFVEIPKKNGKLLKLYEEREEAKEMISELVGTTRLSKNPINSLLQSFGLRRDLGFYERALSECDRLIQKVSQDPSIHEQSSNAFVTFKYESAADMAALRFQMSWMGRQCWGGVSGAVRTSAEVPPLFRGQFKLRVERAADPTNLIWANVELNRREKVTRDIFSIVCAATLTVLAAVLASYIQYTVGSIGKKDANIVPDTEHGTLTKTALSQGASVLSAALIIIVNSIVQATFEYFSQFEKHYHITGREEWLFVKMAAGQIFTFVYLLVSAYDFPWRNGDWAETAGNVLMYLLLGEAFRENLLRVFRIQDVFMRLIAPLFAVSQKQLDRWFAPEPFQLSEHYATITKVFFLSIAFSAVLPLAPLVAGVALLIKSWVDKYSLLRIDGTPILLDERHADMLERLLPFAVVIHCIITPFVYSRDPEHDWMTAHGITSGVSIAVFCITALWIVMRFFNAFIAELKTDEPKMGGTMGKDYFTFFSVEAYQHPLSRLFDVPNASLTHMSPEAASHIRASHQHHPGHLETLRLMTSQRRLVDRLPLLRARLERQKAFVASSGGLNSRRIRFLDVVFNGKRIGSVPIDLGQQFDIPLLPNFTIPSTATQLSDVRDAIKQLMRQQNMHVERFWFRRREPYEVEQNDVTYVYYRYRHTDESTVDARRLLPCCIIDTVSDIHSPWSV